MRQLSGMDAAFVYLESPTTPMHFGGINLYDPSAPAAEIPHAQHAFELLHSVRSTAVVDGVVRYLEYIRATQRDTANQGERRATG